MAVVQVVNREGATQGIATTVVRAVLGDLSLDDVLSKREAINIRLRQELDTVTERWGMKVTNVEIREIVPPPTVQEAMNRQMSAERDRRAKVTEAEGRKQSVVLVAEGERQSRVLRAEGEREAIRLQAEGSANALALVSKSAANIDARTMALQQFEALKALGASPATRLVLPIDLLPMARNLSEYAEVALATARGLSEGGGNRSHDLRAEPDAPSQTPGTGGA
jgi:regulator of protease activity HflC (stomatin/prohibitin superfamily)